MGGTVAFAMAVPRLNFRNKLIQFSKKIKLYIRVGIFIDCQSGSSMFAEDMTDDGDLHDDIQIEEKLIQEFKDRYGTVKEEILLYIEAKYLEHLLKTKGIEFFKETPKDVKLTISEAKTQSLSAKQLYEIVTKTTLKFKLE